MADRAEDVVKQERYEMFDSCIDSFHEGEVTFEQAVGMYIAIAGITLQRTVEQS